MSHRVLIVDDEAGIRQALKQVLEYEDLQVRVAASGGEAINLYTSAGYEIQNYDLQAWNGASWVTVVQQRGNRAVTRSHPISPVTATAIRVLGLRGFAAQISALDNQAPAAAQLAMYQEVADTARRACVYLARREAAGRNPASVEAAAQLYQSSVAAQRDTILASLSAAEAARVAARVQALRQLGAPEILAEHAALLRPLSLCLDIADLVVVDRYGQCAAFGELKHALPRIASLLRRVRQHELDLRYSLARRAPHAAAIAAPA